MQAIEPTISHGHGKTTQQRHNYIVENFDEFVAYAAKQVRPVLYPNFAKLRETHICDKKMWEAYTGWLSKIYQKGSKNDGKSFLALDTCLRYPRDLIGQLRRLFEENGSQKIKDFFTLLDKASKSRSKRWFDGIKKDVVRVYCLRAAKNPEMMRDAHGANSVYPFQIWNANRAYFMEGSLASVEIALTLISNLQTSNRPGELSAGTWDIVDYNACFKCLVMAVMQGKTGEIKDVVLVAGATQYSCIFTAIGYHFAMGGIQSMLAAANINHDTGNSNLEITSFLLPNLQRKKVSETITSYLRQVSYGTTSRKYRKFQLKEGDLPINLNSTGIRHGVADVLLLANPEHLAGSVLGHKSSKMTWEYFEQSIALSPSVKLPLVGFQPHPYAQVGPGPVPASIAPLLSLFTAVGGLNEDLANDLIRWIMLALRLDSDVFPDMAPGNRLWAVAKHAFASMLMYTPQRDSRGEIPDVTSQLEASYCAAFADHHLELRSCMWLKGHSDCIKFDARKHIRLYSQLIFYEFKKDNDTILNPLNLTDLARDVSLVQRDINTLKSTVVTDLDALKTDVDAIKRMLLAALPPIHALSDQPTATTKGPTLTVTKMLPPAQLPEPWVGMSPRFAAGEYMKSKVKHSSKSSSLLKSPGQNECLTESPNSQPKDRSCITPIETGISIDALNKKRTPARIFQQPGKRAADTDPSAEQPTIKRHAVTGSSSESLPIRKSATSDEGPRKMSDDAATAFLKCKAGDTTYQATYGQLSSQMQSKIDLSNMWFGYMATPQELEELAPGDQQGSILRRTAIVKTLDRLIIRRLQHAWKHTLYKPDSINFVPADFVLKPTPHMLAKNLAQIPFMKVTTIDNQRTNLKSVKTADHPHTVIDMYAFPKWRAQEEMNAKQLNQPYESAVKEANDHSASAKNRSKIQAQLSFGGSSSK